MSAMWLPFSNRQAAPFLFVTLVLIAAFSTLINTAAAQNISSSVDREALLAIKSDIIDDPQGLTSSWNASIDLCEWQGVNCSRRHQRVTGLDLSSGQLRGTLSPFIGNLTFLRIIRLLNNSFSGEIPPEIGGLFRLQELRIQNNSFQGNIPDRLSNCSNLQFLNLGYNNLVGVIPDWLGSLPMLISLIVHGNSNLEGTIPPSIGNLASLQTLSFGDCRLHGSIPDIFQRLSDLRRLSLRGNTLVGTLPSSLYNISSLEEIFLSGNQLTGRLPINLGSFQTNLQVVSIEDNQFSGPLPQSLLSSSELGVLDVAGNNFSGKLVITPRQNCSLLILSLASNHFGTGEDDDMNFIDALSICKNLGVLNAGYNQFRGFLPESIGNLSTTLYFLSFASNSFSGGLPSSVSNLSGLTSLDLFSNQLTGTIPANIGNLVNLRRIDLRNNSFSGTIPGSIGNLSLLIVLRLESNELNGSIPASLGNCKNLLRLSLDRNNLTGDIPKQLFEISSLSITLNLGSNQLSGQLPEEIGNLQNLNEIILANNRLSGDLPSSLSACINLENLNISGNFFQGSLPESFSSLRGLQTLDISYNNFSGKIPSFLEVIPLENLNISFNGFDGEVSSRGVFANGGAVSVSGNSRLCGGVPELRLPKCSTSKKKRLTLAVILVISFVSALIIVAMVLLLICCTRKRKRNLEATRVPSENGSLESLVQVSYEMLYKATDGFSVKNFIGEGSFSSVYKGYLEDDVIVAVKVLNLHRRGGSKSFISECEALRNARHRNLTKVVTCCSGIDFQGNEFKAIVYEYMPNGTLDQWLHNEQDEAPRLGLIQRVCVALDVAYALDYLHHHAGKTIIHCDLKPSNILLDEDMVAHVGDFGLSKILEPEYQNRRHSSSVGVRGTIGYTAPEYGVGSKVSTSGDMYSYGILLLEMLTGKRPTHVMFGDGVGLHNYAKTAMDDGSVEVFDPVLLKDDDGMVKGVKGETEGYTRNEMCCRLLLKIGVACSMENPRYRMDTGMVIQELNLVKDTILGYSNVFSSYM